VARPVFAPALVAWIGGSNVSVGVSIGGPSVGWVPLGPREIYHPTYQVTNIYVRNVNVTHRHWHGPNPRYERTVPTGPISYTNQGVAGGVTVVPQGVIRNRQPVSGAVLPVDGPAVARWQPGDRGSAPDRMVATVPVPAPAARVGTQQRPQHRPDVVQHARVRLGLGVDAVGLEQSPRRRGASATPASRKGTSATFSALRHAAQTGAKKPSPYWRP
jgi:hypothetical protein